MSQFPPNQFGGPPPNQFGGPPPNQFGGPPPNQFGGPPPNQFGGPPPNQQFNQAGRAGPPPNQFNNQQNQFSNPQIAGGRGGAPPPNQQFGGVNQPPLAAGGRGRGVVGGAPTPNQQQLAGGRGRGGVVGGAQVPNQQQLAGGRGRGGVVGGAPTPNQQFGQQQQAGRGGLVPNQQQQAGRGGLVPNQQQQQGSSSNQQIVLGGPITDADIKFLEEKDIIQLNVGGVKFTTSKKTLQKYPNSLVGKMFSDDNLKKTKPDKNGFYFIDRNGDAFESVLEFLRTGKLLHQSKKVSAAVVSEELRYWRIAPTLGPFVDTSPTNTLCARIRRQTLDSMYREGRIYIDIFMGLLTRELEQAANYGKSEVYLLMGDPSSATTSSRSSSRNKIVGKHLHDANLHKWLTLRRGHLTLIRQAVEREGLKLTINTGLPSKDWIQFIVSWPLDPNELKGTFNWE